MSKVTITIEGNLIDLAADLASMFIAARTGRWNDEPETDLDDEDEDEDFPYSDACNCEDCVADAKAAAGVHFTSSRLSDGKAGIEKALIDDGIPPVVARSIANAIAARVGL